MPEAKPINTTNLSGIVPRYLRPVSANGGLTISVRHSPAERKLVPACQAVMDRSGAILRLAQAVSAVTLNNPRYEAFCAYVEQLRPEWLAQLGMVSAIPAQGAPGLAANAPLIASLIRHDEANHVDRPSALPVAASLVDDMLVLDKG